MTISAADGPRDTAVRSVARWARIVAEVAVLRPPAARIPPRLAHGRILAEDLVAPEDLPPAAVSAMDGFAVRRDDLAERSALPVVADLPAARGAVAPLAPGAAARIMTAAPITAMRALPRRRCCSGPKPGRRSWRA